MHGGLRGRIHSMSGKLARGPAAALAFWWKMQSKGIIVFHAAFVSCSATISKELCVVSNAGARKVAGVVRRHNHELDRVKTSSNVCVHTFFAKCIVKFWGTHSGMNPTSLLTRSAFNFLRGGRLYVDGAEERGGRLFFVNLGIPPYPDRR